MKLKVIGSIVGVLVAIGLIGAGTTWAKMAMPTSGEAGAFSSLQVGGQGNTPLGTIDSQGAVSNTARTAMCDAYMAALAGHLGIGVDKLAQAGKDTAKDMIDLAVKNNRMTAEQATAAKTRIDQATGNCFLGERGFGHGFPGGKGAPNGQPNPGGPRLPGGPRGGKVITGTRSFDGATLTDVVAGSPAAKAGLVVGDVILAIGGQNIDAQHPVDALVRAKKPGDSLDVKYQHGSETKTASVTLGAQPNNAAVPYLGVKFEYRRSAS